MDRTVTLNQNKYLVMNPRRGSTPKQTDWLSVSRKVTLTLNQDVTGNWVAARHKSYSGKWVVVIAKECCNLTIRSLDSNWQTNISLIGASRTRHLIQDLSRKYIVYPVLLLFSTYSLLDCRSYSPQTVKWKFAGSVNFVCFLMFQIYL
jgi:hypothetical protein